MIVTADQRSGYLPPSPHHLPLQKIYTPLEFDELRADALQCGFVDVAAGPLVRSSYHADETAKNLKAYEVRGT
jgi:lipoic acid synthetase